MLLGKIVAVKSTILIGYRRSGIILGETVYRIAKMRKSPSKLK